MTHPLQDCYDRLDRAYEHLMALHGEIESFFELQPYRFDRERGADGTSYIIRANVVEEPPESLALIVGNCLQSTRSALDLLAWALAARNVGGEPPPHTSFPICLTRDDFHERARGNGISSGTGLDVIRAIRPEAQAVIEESQPYHSGDFEPEANPLWLLDELARIDWHQHPSPLTTTLRHARYTLGRRDASGRFVPDPGLIASAKLKVDSFEDGAEILRISATEFDPSVDVDFDATTQISIRDAGAATSINVVDLLSSIHRHVKLHIVPRFTRFF